MAADIDIRRKGWFVDTVVNPEFPPVDAVICTEIELFIKHRQVPCIRFINGVDVGYHCGRGQPVICPQFPAMGTIVGAEI